MPVTVKDVAVTAEVSLGTVSRVLNGDPSVSTDVRQRVRRAVETLGYTRLRSRGRTNSYSPLKGRNIALVMLGMDRSLVELPSVAAAIHGAEGALKELGANLLLVDIPRADHVPTVLGRNRIDGLLLKGALQGGLLESGDPVLLGRLSQIPSIWFLGKPPGAWGDVVQSDDRQVGQLAAEHLWQHGHRRLGFLNPSPDHATFNQRQAAFEWHARELGAKVVTVLGQTGVAKLPSPPVDAADNVDELIERLLSLDEPPTGIFVPGDVVAAMVYRAIEAQFASWPRSEHHLLQSRKHAVGRTVSEPDDDRHSRRGYRPPRRRPAHLATSPPRSAARRHRRATSCAPANQSPRSNTPTALTVANCRKCAVKHYQRRTASHKGAADSWLNVSAGEAPSADRE